MQFNMALFLDIFKHHLNSIIWQLNKNDIVVSVEKFWFTRF